MTDCTIIKVHDYWTTSWSKGTPISNKKWAARCPICKEIIKQTSYYCSSSTVNSRKAAKDLLHKHMISNHI
jgi:hypothetical protein